MAKNCICCGKKLGILTGENQLIYTREEGLCDQCFSKMYNPHLALKKAYDEEQWEQVLSIYANIQEVVEKSGFLQAGKEYIAQYTQEMCSGNPPIGDPDVWKEKVKRAQEEKREKVQQARQKQEEYALEVKQRIQAFKENQYPIWMTSGYNFEQYEIRSYLGVTSGSVALGTGMFSEWDANISDMLGEESERFSAKLEEAKDRAVYKLKYKAAKMGGNAIIGLDFDYVNFTSNLIGVVANGTVVIIKKA